MSGAIALAVLGLALRAVAIAASGVGPLGVGAVMAAGLAIDVLGQLFFGRTRRAAFVRHGLMLAALGALVGQAGGRWQVFLLASAAQEVILWGAFRMVVSDTEAQAYMRQVIEDDEPAVVLSREPVAGEPAPEPIGKEPDGA